MGLGTGLLGAVIGGFCGGPLGALIGGGIGAVLFNSRSGGTEQPERSAPATFPLEAIFECLGKLAKADGHVSREEAAFASHFMKNLDLPPAARQILKDAFNRGRDSAEPFAYLVRRAAAGIRRMPDSRQAAELVFRTFCSISMIDRDLSPNEMRMLREAESVLGLRGELDDFLREHPEFGKAGRTEERSDDLKACYERLGIPPDASDAEVKKAWREKAKEFHPDRVQGAGLSAAFINFAKQEMQQINRAYERICESRGI